MTSRETISGWFVRGQISSAAPYSHMIVVCDTFSWEDYPVYVKTGEDPREVAAKYDGKNMQKLMEVYNLELPMNEQLDQQRSFNW